MKAPTANVVLVNAFQFNYVILKGIYFFYYFSLFVHWIWISPLVYI